MAIFWNFSKVVPFGFLSKIHHVCELAAIEIGSNHSSASFSTWCHFDNRKFEIFIKWNHVTISYPCYYSGVIFTTTPYHSIILMLHQWFEQLIPRCNSIMWSYVSCEQHPIIMWTHEVRIQHIIVWTLHTIIQGWHHSVGLSSSNSIIGTSL